MNDVMIFENKQLGNIRSVLVDDEPWFVGKDVAVCLGYSNPRKAVIDHVDDEDKGVTNRDTLGGNQNMTIINESGLYSLIFSSKLDSAKQFKRWVTSEVLPAIRKTGSYSTNKDHIAQLIIDAPSDRLPYILQLYGIQEQKKLPCVLEPYASKPLEYGKRVERINYFFRMLSEKGIRPFQFARINGISKSTMYNYVYGHSIPRLERCEELIRMLENM